MDLLGCGLLGDDKEMLVLNHLGRDFCDEPLHLVADVTEEGIPGPSPDEHDGVDRNLGEVHGHGGAQSDGVGADLIRVEMEVVLTNGRCGIMDHVDLDGTEFLGELDAVVGVLGRCPGR